MSSLASLTLLIWEENPEQIKLYLIPKDVSDKYKDYLDQAHDQMVNGQGWPSNQGLKFLLAALHKEESVDAGFEEHIGVLMEYEYKHTANPITGTNITRVYKSGFYL